MTGAVAPKGTGSVLLQGLAGRVWTTLASGKLTRASTFVLSVSVPAGVQQLRVVKPYSKTFAGGTSSALSVTVTTPATPPVVTTTALPAGTARSAYAVALTASGGTAPYTWSAAGLPAGLAIGPSGTLSGTPLAPGVSQVTVVATDSAARSASAVLTLNVVAAAGHAWAWGYNGQGELGNGTVSAHSLVLVPVSGSTSVAAIAGGESAGYAVGSDGTAWAWGDNTSGELGNNSTTPSSVQVRVSGLTAATAVGQVATRRTPCAATAPCGPGATTPAASWATTPPPSPRCRYRCPPDVGYRPRRRGFDGYALRSDGSCGPGVTTAWASSVRAPHSQHRAECITLPTRSVAIGAGNYTGYALAADGTVWAWGREPRASLATTPQSVAARRRRSAG